MNSDLPGAARARVPAEKARGDEQYDVEKKAHRATSYRPFLIFETRPACGEFPQNTSQKTHMKKGPVVRARPAPLFLSE